MGGAIGRGAATAGAPGRGCRGCPRGSDARRPGSPARIALSDDVALIRALFCEYAGSLGVDLSFQRFDEELVALPAGYDAVLVAHVDGEAAGCRVNRDRPS